MILVLVHGIGGAAFGLDRFCCSAEVMLLRAGLLLDDLLAPHVLILGVGLGQVVVAETLSVVEVRHMLGTAANQTVESPLRIRGRAFASATEILLEFDFQGADFALDL